MITNQNYKIGVFDSGVGGLTVLNELDRQLPNESIIYFGDTERVPYGNRSPEEIVQFVREILTWMKTQKVKMVIMACNTSSALALDIVRSEFEFPILGLILPAAKGAVEAGNRIGVISTPATAASNAYRNAILEVDSSKKVWQVGCSEFVPLIESDRVNDPYTKEVAKEYLQPLIEQNVDTLIYGCTHYPHLKNVLQSILPTSITYINPAKYVVEAAEKELEVMGLKNIHKNLSLPTRFCVSGSPTQFTKISKQWLGFTPVVEKVYLSSVVSLDSQVV